MANEIIGENNMDKIKPCPFCGSKDLYFENELLDVKAGQNCPCSFIKRVWAICVKCGAKGPTTTIEAVYNRECENAAIERWNKRTF